MFKIIPSDTKIDFIGKQKVLIGFSILLVLGSFFLLFNKGLNFGIDFTGGAVIQIKFNQAVDTSQVRGWLEEGKMKFSIIQRIGEVEENEFQLKLKGNVSNLQDLLTQVTSVFSRSVGSQGFTVRKVDVVGPRAGKALRASSFWAALYAIIGILIYIIIRFDFRYSPGAIIALLHDSVLILGAFVLTQQEFSLQIVAAVLTIIGYSINDTIIVYDRVRETIKANPKLSLEENINKSVNLTLSRTIVTSITTLLAVSALWIWGGGIIKEFAAALFLGVIVGTYSSVFIASPLFLFMARRQERIALQRKVAGA